MATIEYKCPSCKWSADIEIGELLADAKTVNVSPCPECGADLVEA